MNFSFEKRPSAAMIVAMTALSLALIGTAVAAPSALKLNKAKVRAIADEEIAAKAPGLHVASANTATTATNATNATNATTADTATNANALGGKSLDEVRPVIAGASNAATVADVGTGTDVVTLNYTLAAASRVNFSGSVELGGDNTSPGAAGRCSVRNDGNTVGANYETSFDDIGTNAVNPAVIAIQSSAATVAPGDHTAVIRCSNDISGGNPVFKDDAGLNIIAVPN
jgi:hypothetical protein